MLTEIKPTRNLTEAERQALSDALAPRLTPCHPSAIGKALAKCFAVTKSRETDAVDLETATLVFVEELQEFPADIVEEAFLRWRRSERFRPTVSEIRDLCQREVAWLRHLDRIAKGLYRVEERKEGPQPLSRAAERVNASAWFAKAKAALNGS